MNAGRLPRRRDEARALFRNAILDAAEEVFAESGFRGARIQDIAARARIAVGTVYNHFEQKEDVLSALLEERSRELLEALRERDGDPKAFRDRLRVRVGRLFSYIERHRAFFAIASEHGFFAGGAAAGAPTRPREQAEKFRALFGALIEDGIAAGELEPLAPDVLARFLGATIRAFVLSALADGTTGLAGGADAMLDLFLHGAARRRRKSRARAATC